LHFYQNITSSAFQIINYISFEIFHKKLEGCFLSLPEVHYIIFEKNFYQILPQPSTFQSESLLGKLDWKAGRLNLYHCIKKQKK
jgi:hypothetical protein